MDSSTTAISVPVLCDAHDVSHEFVRPDGTTIRVLEHVDLSVRANEVVALLGPSGCGKSTLLRILAGLIRPTRGEISYRGRALEGLNPGVGFVFQSFALFPWMTMAQNVRVVLDARGCPRDEAAARADQVLRLVGLSGFEDLFPRQLSGGMKQRAGIARALAVDPEVLFLDEPFSQVDALTAESLRAEVVDIWSAADRNPLSILMVSHDIKEVVFMADRIVILGANPGHVLTCVENPLPRPRDYRSSKFARLVDQLHDVITRTEMPDRPATTRECVVEPLPFVSTSEIVGLVEYLDARGGSAELFQIAGETHREFGQVMMIVKAAEMLDLIDTPGRLVILDPDGRRFLRASPEERKRIWRDQLLELFLFRSITDMLSRRPDRALARDVILDTIVMYLPQEDHLRTFETLVRWARYGDLFDYDDRAERLALAEA